ncbi:hypothetical protein PGC08_09625 [Brevibacterium sp. BDJS002]|uniref:hypothetical protein n=1 Tax=Brevibacterium sp. BDJS002 TaxID=3020906 RepID=UPI0023078960|nr:hypothetical protein [Brevibacterium sp. BDJS002]WCE41894.1 hypothetical protein PGC08_09625 [Brevibacterium sp. BDJS002]
MSTAFPFTYPRRIALTAGLKLIQWARRPPDTTKDHDRIALERRNARFRRLARDERLQEQREREVTRYLYLVRPMI